MEASDSTIGVEKNRDTRFSTFRFTFSTAAMLASHRMSCADRHTLFST
jgi:hypothetical protein